MPFALAGRWPFAWGLAFGMFLACAVPLPAQDPGGQAPPDTSMFVRRAMQQLERGDYQACIDELARVLEVDPRNATARFCRALACGQLAVADEMQALRLRSDNRLEEAARLERTAADHYACMRRDIDELLRIGLTDATSIIQLIDGVVQTKLARHAPGGYRERLAARADLLAQARQSLQSYLRPRPGSGLSPPSGMNRVRAEFFLAVVVYRQALRPAEEPGQPDETADRQALDAAGVLMESQIDPASDNYIGKLLTDGPADEVRRWMSYANLYLGLIRTRQGSEDAVGGGLAFQSRYNEALEFYKQAWKLDTGDEYPQGEEKSEGRGLIPAIASRHVPELEKAVKSVAGPSEDLFIDWENGFAYDTNVTLLGNHSPLPPNIGRKDDFRFGTGTAVGYTVDLAKYSPSLDRWTFGALGRASSNWHSSIKEFNEQNYGGSVALQHKTLDAWDGGGTMHGPFYTSLQYDYDYYLLGNDGFLSLNRVSPQFTLYTHDQRAATSFGFRYELRDYQEPLAARRYNRDGNYYTFNVSESVNLVDMTSFYKSLGWQPWGLAYDPVDPEKYDSDDPRQDPTGYRRWLRPYIGFEYGWDSTAGTEYDMNHYLLASGISVPLPYGVVFDFNGQWEWQDYYHRGSMVDSRRRSREDFVQRYRFGFERRFVLVPGNRINRNTLTMDRVEMSLRADVQFTDDDSNVTNRAAGDVFSYDRAIWGLSVAFQFN